MSILTTAFKLNVFTNQKHIIFVYIVLFKLKIRTHRIIFLKKKSENIFLSLTIGWYYTILSNDKCHNYIIIYSIVFLAITLYVYYVLHQIP